jgi:hypothetical protein
VNTNVSEEHATDIFRVEIITVRIMIVLNEASGREKSPLLRSNAMGMLKGNCEKQPFLSGGRDILLSVTSRSFVVLRGYQLCDNV